MFLFLCLVIFVTGCTYSTIISKNEKFTAGCWSPSKKQIAFCRKYDIYRDASGINALPDGGMPKYLHQSLSMYIYDTETKKVKKIADIEGATHQPFVRISWKDNLIAYWLIDSKGIFILNTDGSHKRLLVKDGKMPDISPDAKKVVYVKKKGEIWVINVDGTNNHFITKIPDMVYVFWEEDDKYILLYCFNSQKKPISEVYKLNLWTNEIKKTNLPYLLHFGNVRVSSEYTKNITDEEWEVPLYPERVLLPF